MSHMRTVEVEVGLGGAPSESGLLERIAGSLELGPQASQSWSALADALERSTHEPTRLRLRGFAQLELALPKTAASLLRVFGEHKTRGAGEAIYVEHEIQRKPLIMKPYTERRGVVIRRWQLWRTHAARERRVKRAKVNRFVYEEERAA